MRFVNSLLFLVQARSQKRKAAAKVMNSYLSSSQIAWFFFRPTLKWNRWMENVKIALLVWNCLAEMETGRVEILRLAGQAGWNTGRILLSGN